jgi:TetR/AcrR family fatty acid metabolism transcriptional regulator
MAQPKSSAPRRARSAAKYQAILDAALEVFARKGFYEAKITEIARAAGVADGTIYLYFKNKDDLLISLFEAKLEEVNAGLQRDLDGVVGARERLRHVIRYHLRRAGEQPSLTAFMTIELRRSQKFMKRYAKAQLANYLGQWEAVIDEGKREGVFRPDISTGILKNLLFGALDHATMLWVNNPHRKPADLVEVGDHLIECLERSLTAQS